MEKLMVKTKIALKPSKKLIFQFGFLLSTPKSTAKKMALKKKILEIEFFVVRKFSKSHASVIHCSRSNFKLLSNLQKMNF